MVCGDFGDLDEGKDVIGWWWGWSETVVWGVARNTLTELKYTLME